MIKDEPQEEKIELIVENYAELVKKKRESIGLTQKEFANKINEKESTIHKIETGVWQPNLILAKKLEKTLGLKLIEEHQEKHESSKNKKIEGFTLGDFINVKKDEPRVSENAVKIERVTRPSIVVHQADYKSVLRQVHGR